MTGAAVLATTTVGESPWVFRAHPDVWLLVALLAVGYWYVVTRLGPAWAPAGERSVTRRQVTIFIVALVLLWLDSDWPVHDISEGYLLSVHMMQHLVLTLVTPPMFMIALPGWFWRRVLSLRTVGWIARTLGRVLPAALIYNAVTVITHWPVVVDASLRSEAVHFSVHMVLFTTAGLMWFPVVNRVEGFPQLSYPGRMLYLFLQSIVPTVPASFLTFADGVIYTFYENAPRAFGIGAVEDQQLAGGIMKVYGGLILWTVIVVMFFRWYKQSESEDDTLYWDDVRREIERTPAPKG